jgi:hypothetical protein
MIPITPAKIDMMLMIPPRMLGESASSTPMMPRMIAATANRKPSPAPKKKLAMAKPRVPRPF